MKINAIRLQNSEQKKKRLTPAKTGALLTAGVLGASTAISWIKKPDEMCKVVNECGGKNQYIMKYILGLSLLSAVGALFNSTLSAITNKIKPKHPPRAVN